MLRQGGLSFSRGTPLVASDSPKLENGATISSTLSVTRTGRRTSNLTRGTTISALGREHRRAAMRVTSRTARNPGIRAGRPKGVHRIGQENLQRGLREVVADQCREIERTGAALRISAQPSLSMVDATLTLVSVV